MPAVCEFYGMAPSEFWRLSLPELGALMKHMRQVAEARAAAMKG